jgi:hypothetical protein
LSYTNKPNLIAMFSAKIKYSFIISLILIFCTNFSYSQKIRSLKKQNIENIRLEYDKSVTLLTNTRLPIGFRLLHPISNIW